MANKTLFVKIGTPNWIPEIHQQGPIVTPMELPTKVVLTLVRKGHKLTAVNKMTKEEVKLNVLNATDPFKGTDVPKEEKVVEKEKPISTNIGAPVVETVQPKVVEVAPVVEEVAEVMTAQVEEEEVIEEVEEPVTEVAEEAPVVEEKPHFNYEGKKNKNKNNNFKK